MSDEHDSTVPKSPGKAAQASARARRLAAELRANLSKRKALARTRAAEATAGEPASSDDTESSRQ